MADNYWDKLTGDDEHAATYMQTYGEGVGSKTRFVLGEFINDDESVLDVGCGPGWNFDHFKEHGPKVTYKGLDYSERFVRVSNDRADSLYGCRPFEKGDVRKVEQPNESWDVVVMQDVLEHTNGYEEPVKEALRVAKKRAIFTFWHLTENDDHVNNDGDDGYGAWYSRGKWEEYLNTFEEKGYVWFSYDFDFPEGRTRNFYIVEKLGIEK